MSVWVDVFRLFKRIAGRKSGASEARPTPLKFFRSPEDIIVASVNRFREQMAEATQKLASDQARSLEHDREKIRKAEKLACDTWITIACCHLLSETWYYPSWSKRDDFAKYQTPFKNLEFEERRTDKEITKITEFDYGGQRYKLVFTGAQSYRGDDKPGTLQVFTTEEMVLSMSVVHERDADVNPNDYRPVLVEVLKVGPWIAHFIEIQEQQKLETQKRLLKWEAERIHKQGVTSLKGFFSTLRGVPTSELQKRRF